MKHALRRTDVVFSDVDRPLRKDVKRLGRMVGDLLIEQGGHDLYDRVEKARKLAIERRDGNEDAAADLIELLRSLEPVAAQDLIRAFSTYFEMVNTAEKVHRIRRRREYLRTDNVSQPFGVQATLERLRGDGLQFAALQDLLNRLLIEPVFTAHPTEPTRRTILRKEQSIVRLLVDLLDPSMTPQEVASAEATIRSEVTSIWQTDEHPSEQMTVADELEHVLFFLTDVLYRVMPAFYESIETAADNAYGKPAEGFEVPILLRFASWVGGDMDGNPNVTSKTIRESMARQRSLILNLYFRECGSLAGKLSQTSSRATVAPAVTDRIEDYRQHFPDAMHAVPARHRSMPYRILLRLIQARLQATFDDSAFPYDSAEEFEADIQIIENSLETNLGRNAGLFATRRFLRRIRSFGFHLLTLDIRQDALVHREVVALGLGEENWLQESIEYRTRRICEAIENRESPNNMSATQMRKTLAVFQAIAYCRRRYGKKAIGPFVISMTQGPDDILSVLLLAHWGELATRRDRVPLDIVPLLETVDDLENGTEIMHQILDNPTYMSHIESRQMRQLIMIGYSDSNKDSGIAASRWALYKAQKNLVRELTGKGIDITLFHGRGGSVSRGGGTMRSAVLGAPRGTVNGRLRVTEQGEIINEKYGLRGIALRTLEQAVGAVALATFREQQPQNIPEVWRDMMAIIAAKSRERYRHLVYESPDFFDYFRRATPIDIIEQMQIGSRPASRRAQTGIADLRAIPWVFAWTQSRYILPGWYGLGSGIAAAIETHGEQAFADMFNGWFFFKALTADVEMVLAKADLEIAASYSELAGALHERFFRDIDAEFRLTEECILNVTGHENLLDDDRTLQRAITLRNPYVDPMSLLQVDLLRRWRETGREDEALRDALFASVNGIAQGLQNTG